MDKVTVTLMASWEVEVESKAEAAKILADIEDAVGRLPHVTSLDDSEVIDDGQFEDVDESE